MGQVVPYVVTAPPPAAVPIPPFQLYGHLPRKVAMARSGVLPALSHLCLSGDRERQIHAVAAMANIAEMVEGRTQKRMIEEGCIKPLLGLVDSPDVSGMCCRRCQNHPHETSRSNSGHVP